MTPRPALTLLALLSAAALLAGCMGGVPPENVEEPQNPRDGEGSGTGGDDARYPGGPVKGEPEAGRSAADATHNATA